MFHIPAHKNVEHPAGQVHPGRVEQENLALSQAIERAIAGSPRTFAGIPVIALESWVEASLSVQHHTDRSYR